jgi:hypothetical protein
MSQPSKTPSQTSQYVYKTKKLENYSQTVGNCNQNSPARSFLQITLQKAIDDANNAKPIDFDGVTKGILYQLKLKNYNLRDSAAEMRQGRATKGSIIKTVRDKILSKVNEASRFETKFSTLSDITTIISGTVSIGDEGEFASAFRD